MSTWQDIGDGVEVRLVTDARDRFVGLVWRHTCRLGLQEDGGSRVGSIYFDKPWNREDASLSGRHLYELTSWEPLTMPESLLCTICGRQGFIREGAWVPVEAVAR